MKSQLSIAGNVYTMIYLYCNKEVELMFVPYFFQTLFVFTFECQEDNTSFVYIFLRICIEAVMRYLSRAVALL